MLPAHAAFIEDPVVSTAPIGSPFYRHLAADLNMDLRELVKFEKKGFGRTEICTLILISSATSKPLKSYGKRRLKDNTSLEQFAAEAHLDYGQLNKEARKMKEMIEAKGDKDLPPPLFEVKPTPTPTPTKKEAQEKKKNKEPEKDKDPTKDKEKENPLDETP